MSDGVAGGHGVVEAQGGPWFPVPAGLEVIAAGGEVDIRRNQGGEAVVDVVTAHVVLLGLRGADRNGEQQRGE